MDYSEAVERISRKFKKSGNEINREKVEVKLRRLIEEFGVQPAEAERSVSNETAKEFNIPPAIPQGSPGFGECIRAKGHCRCLSRRMDNPGRESGFPGRPCIAGNSPERDCC